MPFWRNLGRALQSIWETITTPESPPEPVEYEDQADYEEPTPQYEQGDYGFADSFANIFGGEDERPADESFVYSPGDGPYPDDWGYAEMDFWDAANDGKSFESPQNYADAQDAFEQGFMTPGLSQEEREAARQEYLIDMDEAYFEDWEDFRDYWEEISPIS